MRRRTPSRCPVHSAPPRAQNGFGFRSSSLSYGFSSIPGESPTWRPGRDAAARRSFLRGVGAVALCGAPADATRAVGMRIGGSVPLPPLAAFLGEGDETLEVEVRGALA